MKENRSPNTSANGQVFVETNNQISSKKIKPCCVRNCHNTVISFVKVKYVNKFGWLCKSCKLELSKLDLIEEV
jgi:hypothetical protein